MFTGIVEETGTILGAGPDVLSVAGQLTLKETRPGDSIAVNGVCLTVTACQDAWFSVSVMPETLRLTNLGLLRRGDEVNLERAVPLGGRVGGHLVQGHVDGTGRVTTLVQPGNEWVLGCSAPGEIMRYVVKKGFVAVDGVSLTVVDCDDEAFRVSLVAYTREHSTLGKKRPGDVLNLEVDIMAKYIERFQQKNSQGVTLEFLTEHGFL